MGQRRRRVGYANHVVKAGAARFDGRRVMSSVVGYDGREVLETIRGDGLQAVPRFSGQPRSPRRRCPQRVLSEFILAEFYLQLRNPAIFPQPLSAPAAVQVIQIYRHHPRWRIFGYPADSLAAQEALWQHAAAPQFACHRLFDTRTALSLCQHGVSEFATANVKDFQDFGFTRAWNPLTPG